MRRDLTAAMKARQPDAVAALRTALAALDNAEAVPVEHLPEIDGDGPVAGARTGVGSTEMPRRELSLADVRAILRAQIAERMTAVAEYRGLGRVDEAGKLQREAAVLERYLGA